MKLKTPDDPSITAWNEKTVAVNGLKRELLEITRAKEQGRELYLSERRANLRPLMSLDGYTNLSAAAFHEEQRRLDKREGELLEEIQRQEAALESIKGKRSKAIVSANMATFIEILRRRAHALIEVSKCNELEEEFHYLLKTVDVHSNLRAMVVKATGNWSDPQSLCQFHLAELRRYFDEFKNESFE
jgi:hypothetical protein